MHLSISIDFALNHFYLFLIVQPTTQLHMPKRLSHYCYRILKCDGTNLMLQPYQYENKWSNGTDAAIEKC